MSRLALPKSEISEKPSGNSVTLAIPPTDKEGDTDRKMKFFGIIQAFREGRYPNNEQIDDTLKYTLAHSPVDVKRLSPDGQKLVQDVRELIETARQIVLEKNSDEELQNFLYSSTHADVKSGINVRAPINKKDAQNDQETAGEALKTLAVLFLRNGELRKIFQDLGYLGRDLFADGASMAAELARPDEEKLSQVDQPGPDDEFLDDIPGKLKKKKEQAQQKGEQLKQDASQHANDLVESVDADASSDANKENLAQEAKKKASKVSDRIPQKYKDLAKEQKDKVMQYLQENFSQERRDQSIYRLKKVIVECQRHRDYQDAIDYLITTLEQYSGHASSLHEQAVETGKEVRSKSNVATAEATFRRLIEKFADGRPTQPILDALDQIYTDAKSDTELKDWFKRLDGYVQKCLQEPGFILKDDANVEAKKLIDSGKTFFDAKGKYAGHKDNLFREFTFFFQGMAQDPLNQALGSSLDRIVKDLFLNSDGNVTFKSQLWSDIRDPILPEMLKQVGNVPIPRIEYVDASSELVVENLLLDAINLVPTVWELESRNYFKLSQFSGKGSKANIGDVQQHSIKITLSQIQTFMSEVHFYYRKKSGFPKLNEHGTADVLIGGNGLSVSIHLMAETAPSGKKPTHIFTVKRVKAKIDKLNFAIRNSKHDFLIKILKPLATGLIKKQICKAAEEGIRGALEDLDRHLIELRGRHEHNKDIEGKSFLDSVKETFRKEKSDKESTGTFKFATSKRNSILPNVVLADGLLSKVDDRNETVKTESENADKRWYSSAFSIVSRNQPEPENVEVPKRQSAASKGEDANGSAAGAENAAAGATVTATATATSTTKTDPTKPVADETLNAGTGATATKLNGDAQPE